MKTVKLITCDDAFQAHVIQGALKNEGIASVLHNENMSSVMRGYVRDVTGVDILPAERRSRFPFLQVLITDRAYASVKKENRELMADREEISSLRLTYPDTRSSRDRICISSQPLRFPSQWLHLVEM